MTRPARFIQLALSRDRSTGTPPADTDLLRRYAVERDEAAFTELVRRNGPLVLRACRHILGEAHADDAFQTVFLLLARSADRLTRTGALAGVVARRGRSDRATRARRGPTAPA
ncbi:RNA polymerase sigma factor [Frigoriglobus tundricola]|uniref:RNA polymerase sigma-70 region 2 domain-containing protein n=1 Tax=Frigoriglobus tundricola TaxID=2774151 RepID=A0A6M5Z1G8_9BACT|nr:hypothetical protein FTUN_7273 [Frigoriglobus tundricola]